MYCLIFIQKMIFLFEHLTIYIKKKKQIGFYWHFTHKYKIFIKRAHNHFGNISIRRKLRLRSLPQSLYTKPLNEA